MIVTLSVVARHVGAAAPVPLADTTLVQCVGGEEHSITANGLTFSRHANPSQVGELAGGAVSGRHHELPLAVHSGAV